MANGHGGARKKAGRIPKSIADEQAELVAKHITTHYAVKCLKEAMSEGNIKAIELCFDLMRKGKLTQAVDVTTNGESIGVPIATWSDIDRT